jgi:hypothetical protein
MIAIAPVVMNALMLIVERGGMACTPSDGNLSLGLKRRKRTHEIANSLEILQEPRLAFG